MSKEMVGTAKEMIAAGFVAIIFVVILTMIDLALFRAVHDTHNMIEQYVENYEIPMYEI